MTDSTRTAYAAGLNRWLLFIREMTGNSLLSLADLTPARLRAQLSSESLYPAAFILYCYSANLQPGSVAVYLAGVRFFATDHVGAPAPTPATVARLLAGYKAIPPEQTLSSRVLGSAARPPADLDKISAAASALWTSLEASGLNPSSFHGALPAPSGSRLGLSAATLPTTAHSSRSTRALRDARMLAAILVGFFGAMRASEYLQAPTGEAQLRLLDTKLYATGVPFKGGDQLHLRIRRSKTNPSGDALQVKIIAANPGNTRLCPLLAVVTYINLRSMSSPLPLEGAEPLFALANCGPIPLDWFNQSLRAVFKHAGIASAESFSSHCLRIGAATEVHGLSKGDAALTAAVGGWRSEAWNKYVREDARSGVQTTAQSLLIAASAPAALLQRNRLEGWDRAPVPHPPPNPSARSSPTQSPLPHQEGPLPAGAAARLHSAAPARSPSAIAAARGAALAEAATFASRLAPPPTGGGARALTPPPTPDTQHGAAQHSLPTASRVHSPVDDTDVAQPTPSRRRSQRTPVRGAGLKRPRHGR